MGVLFHRRVTRLVSDDELNVWRGIPTTVIADELNRYGGMNGRIRPISQQDYFVGEALTVQVMVGDNLPLHIAVKHASPRMALIVDAGAFLGTAVWGEILHTAATQKELAGIVIDGAVRDRAALQSSTLPVFAVGSTPNGPHKGWGGQINGPVHCGNVAVHPNDLIVADADGVVVIPRETAARILSKCKDRILSEARMLEELNAGKSTLELLDLEGVSPP